MVHPALNGLPKEEHTNAWYQHNGPPPHRIRLVTDWLEEHFGDKWIATNGPFR